MSKSSKTAARIERLKLKRSRKEHFNKLYQQWSEEGKNTKSKRAKSVAAKAAKAKLRKRNPEPANVGCLVSHFEQNIMGLVRMKFNQRDFGEGQFTSKYSKQVNAYIQANALVINPETRRITSYVG